MKKLISNKKKLEKNPQSYIYKLIKDIIKVNCLKMSLIAEDEMKNGHVEKVFLRQSE